VSQWLLISGPPSGVDLARTLPGAASQTMRTRRPDRCRGDAAVGGEGV